MVIKINPSTNEVKNKVLKTLRLLNPLIFKISSSFLSIISKKKNWVPIKKIKGKISKSVDGTFKPLSITGKKKPTSKSLKKPISSNKLSIKVNVEKIKKIFRIFFKNNLIKYNSNVLIIKQFVSICYK